MTSAQLLEHVESFASFDTGATKGRDNAHFLEMLSKGKIAGKCFTSADAELLFTKAEAKDVDKIAFKAFEKNIISAIAVRLRNLNEQIGGMVVSSAPKSRGTKDEAVRFHEGKSTYIDAAKQSGRVIAAPTLEMRK